MHAAAAIVVGAAMLSWVALWNGYPLVFADSLRYLNGGILRYVPSEAPIFYGAFMIPFHLNGVSLWPVVAAQCLLTAYAISASVRALDLFEPSTFVLLMAFLAITTSAPWFTAFIMPDFLAAVAVLSLFALFCGWSVFRPLERTFLVALSLLALASHVSHIALGLGLAALFTALWLFRRTVAPRMLATILALPVVAALAIVGLNLASRSHAAVLTRDGPVMLLARAFADGPAEDYMRTNCPDAGWKLCAFLPQLPHDSELFLWSDDRSVWGLGISGDELRREAGQIVSGTVRSYPERMLTLAAGNFFRQIMTFDAGVDFKRWPESDKAITVTGVIRRFFPHEFAELMGSRQQTGRLEMAGLNLLYAGAAALSLVGLVGVLIRLRDPKLTEFGITVAVALMVNAAATAPFSVVAPRYQARIVWLLPLAFAVSLIALHRRRVARPALTDHRSMESSV